MADSSLDPKNLEQYLKNLKAAQRFSKEVNSSFSEWESASKNIKQYSKDIADQQELIAKLTAEMSEAGVDRKKELQSQIKKENEVLSIHQAQLKLLRKQTSVWKTLGNESIKYVKGLWGQIPNLVTGFSDMDGAARRTSVQIGLGSKRMGQFQTIAAQSASDLALMGLESKSSAEMMSSFADATGRQSILGKNAVVQMGALSQRLGMAHTEVAAMAGQMDNFGYGSDDAVKLISEIADVSDKMGVNTSKVTKSVSQNLKLVNRLSFKGGVKGMAMMAAYTEKFKVSMEDVASFADKVFRPEGAIDAAANLQVLGGGLSKLGDPFKLMYEARNNPEEFAKSLVKATDSVAVFNKKTGEFEVTGLQLDRLREAADATGTGMDTLVSAAKESAKYNMFDKFLKGSGEQKEFLSSIAEMKDGKAQIAVKVDPKTGDKVYKQLSQLSESEQQLIATRLMKEQETNEKAAMRAQSFMEKFKNLMASIATALYPTLEKISKMLENGGFDKIVEWSNTTLIPMIKKFLAFLGPEGALGLYLGAQLAPWIARGVALGTGFRLSVGGLLSKMAGQGVAGAAAGAVGGGQGKFYKGGQFMPGGGRAPKGGSFVGQAGQAGQAGQMGQSAGSNATNMLKGAAAILILSAALFVFAKAMQELKGIGYETYVGAAAGLGILSLGLLAVSKIMENSTGSIIKGSFAIAILGAALIPFAYAMSLLSDVGVGTMLGAALALGAFALVAGIMGGAIVPILLGSVAILALSGALMVFGFALQYIAPGMEMFINSLSNLPSVILPLLMLGPALIGTSIGLGMMSLSLIGFAASWLLGGWAFKSMVSSVQSLEDTDFTGMATSLKVINSVDLKKVAAIKELANSLSLAGLMGGFKIEFDDLEVKGNINIKGADKTTSILFEEPHLSRLKDLIWDATDRGKNGRFA